MLLDGQLAPATRLFEVRDPWTREVVGTASHDGPEDVLIALDHLKSRSDFGAEARSLVLANAATALNADAERFARLITAESGNSLQDARKEVQRAVRNLRVAATEASRLLGEAIPFESSGRRFEALTRYEPVGPILAITPFNRPLNQVVVKVAPAIAAGSPVLLKPSEKTPLTALAFAELLVEAGLPAGLLAVVTGPPEPIVNQALASERVRMVTFTGSTRVGRAIAGLSGYRRIAMELGGNDPLIVLADGDLALAARIAADGAFATAGQSCRGIKRLLIVDSIADEFIGELHKLTASKTWGNPWCEDTQIGSLIDNASADLVEKRVRDALSSGAQLVCGGARNRAALAPTVLDRVSPTCELVQFETFGPIAPVIRVQDAAQAVAIANSVEQGLQAGVITNDFAAFQTISSQLEVGGVALMDGPGFDSPVLPFGGVKDSGMGREGIRFSVREMSVIKTVVLPGACLPSMS